MLTPNTSDAKSVFSPRQLIHSGHHLESHNSVTGVKADPICHRLSPTTMSHFRCQLQVADPQVPILVFTWLNVGYSLVPHYGSIICYNGSQNSRKLFLCLPVTAKDMVKDTDEQPEQDKVRRLYTQKMGLWRWASPPPTDGYGHQPRSSLNPIVDGFLCKLHSIIMINY